MTASLTRRQLLQAGGLTLGALSLGRRAAGQAPKDGGTFTSARTTEATGLDPQLVPAFSRSARSPLMYNQLVRFEPDMTPVPELAESWQVSSDGLQRALPYAFGSRMSRSPSPIRLNASTAVMIATPGNTEIHGAVSR